MVMVAMDHNPTLAANVQQLNYHDPLFFFQIPLIHRAVAGAVTTTPQVVREDANAAVVDLDAPQIQVLCHSKEALQNIRYIDDGQNTPL